MKTPTNKDSLVPLTNWKIQEPENQYFPETLYPRRKIPMDLNDYQEAAQRTSKEPDAGVQGRLLMFGHDLKMYLSNLAYWSQKVEDLKRKIFYNSAKIAEPADSELPPEVISLIKSLHGIIGIASELHELIEPILSDQSDTWRANKTSALEEGGDLLWYLAELLEAHNLTIQQVAQTNIEKLYERYPEKFDGILAIRRNLEAEAQVLKAGLRSEIPETAQQQIVELSVGEETSSK